MPHLIKTQPLRGWLSASGHQDVIDAIEGGLLVIIVLGSHGELSIGVLDHLDRGEVWVHVNAFALELPFCVLCCLWIKACSHNKILGLANKQWVYEPAWARANLRALKLIEQ